MPTRFLDLLDGVQLSQFLDVKHERRPVGWYSGEVVMSCGPLQFPPHPDTLYFAIVGERLGVASDLKPLSAWIDVAKNGDYP